MHQPGHQPCQHQASNKKNQKWETQNQPNKNQLWYKHFLQKIRRKPQLLLYLMIFVVESFPAFGRQDDGRHLWWGNSWSNRHKVDGAFRRTAAGKLRTVARGNGWKVDVSSFSMEFLDVFFFEKRWDFWKIEQGWIFSKNFGKMDIFLKKQCFQQMDFQLNRDFESVFDDIHVAAVMADICLPWPGPLHFHFVEVTSSSTDTGG